jgi:microsomal dipeptidase-like Zn-dependent dipeptidase
MRTAAIVALALLVLILAAVFTLAPAAVERGVNKVLPGAATAVPDGASQLHKTLFVADLHGDSLLWARDLLTRSDFGHIDLPRLQEGGVDLQVFAAPTQVPYGINYERNRLDWDIITLVSLLQRWPPSTWTSATARAVHMADKLHAFARASRGSLEVITTTERLEAVVRRQQSTAGVVAAVLAIEGLHAIEGDLANLDRLYQAGYRMMAPTHFFDNDLGGSAHGYDKGGLTDFGAQVIRAMEDRKIIVDLAHASPPLVDDVLAIATRPVVVSHTGVKATCDNVRNLGDDHIRRIAAGGGVIGIGYWDAAVCDVRVAGIVKAIKHVTDLVGAEHVALGSDFDGGTETPFDTAGLNQITAGLLAAGFSEADIRNIMGGNVLRLLRTRLPAS